MNRKYGWKRDYHDSRDMRLLALPMPEFREIDLRPGCPPIYDQGNIGSCVANALCLAAGYDIRLPLSRQFLYWNARKMEGLECEDSGCRIRDAIKSFASIGVCPERAWPYSVYWATPPAYGTYGEAKYFKAVKYRRVPKSRHGLLSALVMGHPVVLGIQVYRSFESDFTRDTGAARLPFRGDKYRGGHAITIVGSVLIEEHEGVEGPHWYRFANSWGTEWGDNGFGVISEEYLLSDLSEDWWVVESIELPND